MRFASLPLSQRPQLPARRYPSWVRKIGERTVTHTLNPAQAERYRPMFHNARRLRQLVSELELLTAQQVEQTEGWS